MHQVGFHKKASLAGTGTADNKNVFISCILRLLWSARHHQPFRFCQYDITADELLSGAGGNTATKTEQAERLILDLLADGKELASEDIVKAAAEAGISERTVQNAKRNMGGILGARRVGGQWYNFIKKKQPPEPAS